MEELLLEIIKSVDSQLWGLLIKAFIGFAAFQVIRGIASNLAIYVRIRFSDLFSKRTVIVYDGFEGVIEEISMSGIFMRSKDGVTKFVPLSRWYFGDIRYPNTLD